MVFAHIPLWSVYRSGDGERRQRAGAFTSETIGSVTVLNGHIHQTMQKVETTRPSVLSLPL